MTKHQALPHQRPQADLDDLADRLARTRFAEELPGYGVPVAGSAR